MDLQTSSYSNFRGTPLDTRTDAPDYTLMMKKCKVLYDDDKWYDGTITGCEIWQCMEIRNLRWIIHLCNPRWSWSKVSIITLTTLISLLDFVQLPKIYCTMYTQSTSSIPSELFQLLEVSDGWKVKYYMHNCLKKE